MVQTNTAWQNHYAKWNICELDCLQTLTFLVRKAVIPCQGAYQRMPGACAAARYISGAAPRLNFAVSVATAGTLQKAVQRP